MEQHVRPSGTHRPIGLGAVLWSLALALWLEAFYRFGATFDPQTFAGAALVYTLYLVPAQALMRALPQVGDRVWLAVWGTLGLMFEWFAIGNSPWGNPDALQSGMLAYHGAYPVWGRILAGGPTRRRRIAAWLLAGFSLLGLAGVLLPQGDIRFLWFLLVPLGLFYVLAGMTLLGRPRG